MSKTTVMKVGSKVEYKIGRGYSVGEVVELSETHVVLKTKKDSLIRRTKDSVQLASKEAIEKAANMPVKVAKPKKVDPAPVAKDEEE